MNHVHNIIFFDKEMQIGHSKQVAIADVKDPFDLPDGSPSFKDFKATTSHHRFNGNQNITNQICSPSKSLHFCDPPVNLTVDDVEKFFTDQGASKPESVSIELATSNKSSIVTIEFENVNKATEALVICNNLPYNVPGIEASFIVKLWFTQSNRSHSSSKVEFENVEKHD
jgi:heterogeneous nuclear ribonucleoprotein L